MHNRSFAGAMVGDIARGASPNLLARLRAARLHLRNAEVSGDAEELRKARAEAASAVGDADRLWASARRL
jgi:hypothetical protein